LRALWPALRIAGKARNGLDALRLIDEEGPQIAFLDIRMPGLTGLQVASRLAGGARAPHIVFIIAYDQYAVDAFELSALDYLLKPPTLERLDKTVTKLKAKLSDGAAAAPADLLKTLVAQLSGRIAPVAVPAFLQWIRAAQGGETRLIAIDEVIYFQSNDKYTRVFTHDGESLIRTPLRELLAQLDPAKFWQIHRGTVVSACHVAGTRTDLRGRLNVKLKGRPEQLVVSRNFTEQFRQM
jgi:DNA-binding LytR/AlgR family response regulator